MANTNAPFGALLAEDEGKQFRVRRYPKKSGNAIFCGDFVIQDASGTVDVAAERARLEKDLATAQKDMKTAEVKLSNEGFMAKAPANVVAEIKERMAATSADIERITAQLAALK
jgi:valyl-tRNA synthetase